MKVLDLRCGNGHSFEGWFGSEDDFQSQCERGLVECPLCADRVVARLPSAPRLNTSKLRDAPRPPDGPTGPSTEVTLQGAWMKAMRHVLANTDDVGERFAEEARRIHYGEVDERAIRGRATREETQALHDEGIDVMPLPMPAAMKGRMQ